MRCYLPLEHNYKNTYIEQNFKLYINLELSLNQVITDKL